MSSVVTPEPKSGSDSPTPPKPRRKRGWRRTLLLLALLAIALAVAARVTIAVAFPHVLGKVAAAYDMDASYSRMEMYLLGGDVGLWDLTFRPKAGGPPLMAAEYARGDVSALNLLRGRLVVTRAELDGMDLDVRRDADGRIPALEKLLAARPAAVESDDDDGSAAGLSLDPPFRLDAVRVNRLRARWTDRAVVPPVETRLELTLRLSDVGVPGRPARLLVEGTSPPLLDTFRVEGTADAQGERLDANVDVLVRGLHPKPAAGYLAPAGVRPVAESLTLTAAAEVNLRVAVAPAGAAPATTRPANLAGTVTLANLSAKADGQEAAGVDRVVVQIDSLGDSAARLARVTIDGVRANAARTAEGNVRFAGLELVAPAPATRPTAVAPAASPEPPPSPTPTVAVAATQPGAPPLALSLGELAIRNVRLAFQDEAVSPAATLALAGDHLTVSGLDSTRPDAPASVAGAFSSPGLARAIRLGGAVRPFAATRTLDVKFAADGVRPDAVRGYLDALGVESTLADGTMTADLSAALALAPDGTVRADARLANVRLADGADGELLAFDGAHVSGVSLDRAGSSVQVGAIDLAGPRFTAQRALDGSIIAFGLRTKPVAASVPPPAPAAPASSTNAAPAAAAPAAAASPAAPPRAPTPSPLPRLVFGRLTWKGIDVRLVDEAVAPATAVAIEDAGVELADVVIDLDPRAATAAAPGKVRAWVAAAGVADALNVEGTVTPAAGAVTADLKVDGKGLRGDLLAPYLRAAGVEPTLRDGSLELRARAALARKGAGALAASLAVESLRYADGGTELVGLDRLAVDDVALTADGVAVAAVVLDKPRARAERNADGSLSVAGFRVHVPSTRPAEADDLPAPTRAPPATSPAPAAAAAPFVATLGTLRVNDGALAWVDRAVTPPVDTVGRASVEVDQFVFGREAAPAAVRVVAKLEETLEDLSVTGVVSPSTSAPVVRLDVSGSGLREGVLASYLPPGTNVATADGRFRAKLDAGVAPHAQGGRSAKLVVSEVDYRDGDAPDPLLSFDAARVLVSRADVPGKVVALDEVSLTGLRAVARRAADGSIHALGLKFGPAVPAPDPPAPASEPAAPAAPAPPSTRPSGSTDVNALIAAGREKAPLITLGTLAVDLRGVSFVDETRPGSDPVALADVTLRNRAPIELLGDDPQSRPPVDLELAGQVDPLVGRFVVTTQVAPFASQPSLQVDIAATGISGAGLTAILPELRGQVDGAGLADGQFGASLEATAKVAKRGPFSPDFSKPMEVTAVLRDVAFRGDGAADGPVLAGVQEVRADGARIDPADGSVIVRSLEVTRPTANAWRDADGVHALGLLIKTPSTRPATAPAPTGVAPAPEAPPPADGGGDTLAAVAAAEPRAEMTIEKLTVSGVDVNLEDRSVDPPLIVPLNSLEAEVRGLSNAALREARPIRFNVTAGAGKVPLEPDKPPRALLSEVAASGNLTLYPSPRGWARSSVSGLEMLSLTGPAAASKVSIQGGVFDSRVDVRFRDDGALDARSRFAFTDLRMSEPPDGPIRRALKLPGPLDAMIVVLQDASGAVTVPLNLTVKEYSVGGGQVAGAAVTALGKILATAMASAPLKVTGGVTELVGIDRAVPFLGRRKPTGPREAGAVDFYAGAGATAGSTVTLAQLVERMRRDKTLEVTLRHELGGGDVARAARRANPSAEEAAALGGDLRRRKAELLRQRAALAAAARATLVADPGGGAAATALSQLRELEAQLAATEDALDRAYELTRPGADRQAERRTRVASLEIAQERLDAIKRLVVAAGVPNAEDRVRVIKPQFTPAEGDAGGKVTMVVTSKKKP